MALPSKALFTPPPGNNGRAIHWTTSLWHAYIDNANQRRRWERELLDCNIRAAKVLDDGGGSSKKICQFLAGIGILPIVRFYRPKPNPGHIIDREIQTLREINALTGELRCPVETNNEPNLQGEWNGPMPERWWEVVFDNILIDAELVQALGENPWCFPAFSPGAGNMTDPATGQLVDPLTMFATQHSASDRGLKVLEKAWIAEHNYAINHDLRYPYDPINQEGKLLTQAEYDRHGAWAWDGQPLSLINEWRESDKNPGDDILNDSICFLGYQKWHIWSRKLLGEAMPVITTEGGVVIGNRDDRRYPRVTPEIQAERTLAIARYMMDEAPVDYLFHCDWLAGDAEFGNFGSHGQPTTWESQGWWTHWHDQAWGFNGQIPVVARMKALPSYPRKNGADVPDPPEPPPGPVEPPDPPPPDPPVPDTIKLVNVPVAFLRPDRVTIHRADVPAGEDYWHIYRLEWLRKKEHIFFRIRDREGDPMTGALAKVYWADGSATAVTKANGELGDFPMFALLPAYNFEVIQEGLKSDWIEGLGLGIPETIDLGLTEHAGWIIDARRAVSLGPDVPPAPDPPDDLPPMSTELPGYFDISGELMVHPTLRYDVRVKDAIVRAIIHHAGIEGATPEGTAQFCVNVSKYAAISYAWWVYEDGTVRQTRSMLESTAHAGEAINKVSIAICLEGNFEHREPGEVQLAAARKLIDDIEARFVKRQLIVEGHKKHRPTICPGTDWHIWGKALIEAPPPDPFCEVQAREALGRVREAQGLLDEVESGLEEVIGNETDG